MASLSNGFVAPPGGFSTSEELCEILAWSQLGVHGKPVFICFQGVELLNESSCPLNCFKHRDAQLNGQEGARRSLHWHFPIEGLRRCCLMRHLAKCCVQHDWRANSLRNCVRPTRYCAWPVRFLPRRSSTASRGNKSLYRSAPGRVRGRANLQIIAGYPVRPLVNRPLAVLLPKTQLSRRPNYRRHLFGAVGGLRRYITSPLTSRS